MNSFITHVVLSTCARFDDSSEGEYGVGAGHVPYAAQLKPGVLTITHEEGSGEPEKYFVAGGYALTHPDSTTDVVCPEAVKLDDLDTAAISSQYEAAKSAYNAAASGSVEQAEAQIAMLKHKITHLCITKDGTNNSGSIFLLWYRIINRSTFYSSCQVVARQMQLLYSRLGEVTTSSYHQPNSLAILWSKFVGMLSNPWSNPFVTPIVLM